MKVKTKDIRDFKAASSSLPKNQLLPILGYLKFSKGSIAKSNLESFVIMKADITDEMLIDENILMSFIEFVETDELTLMIDKKQVLISDGKNKVWSPTEDVAHFPAINYSFENPLDLTKEIIDNVRIAANFTMADKSMAVKEYIFLGNNLIAASNGFAAFLKPIQLDFQLCLHYKTAEHLCKFDSVKFSETETYHFFENGKFIYGFIKDETKFINMAVFNNIGDGKVIKVNKAEILKFCNICNTTISDRSVTANIFGRNLMLSDNLYGVNITIPISVDLAEFAFNPRYLGLLLNSLPDTEVNFIKATNKYFITGESGFVSLIMEQQKVN